MLISSGTANGLAKILGLKPCVSFDWGNIPTLCRRHQGVDPANSVEVIMFFEIVRTIVCTRCPCAPCGTVAPIVSLIVDGIVNSVVVRVSFHAPRVHAVDLIAHLYQTIATQSRDGVERTVPVVGLYRISRGICDWGASHQRASRLDNLKPLHVRHRWISETTVSGVACLLRDCGEVSVICGSIHFDQNEIDVVGKVSLCACSGVT